MLKIARILAALIPPLVMSSHCLACRCNDPGPVRGSYERKGIIVSAKVIRIDTVAYSETILESEVKRTVLDLKDDPGRLALFTSKSLLKVTVLVTERFKGEGIPNTITIYTPVLGASCGFRFQLNQEYIIYEGGGLFGSLFFDGGKELKNLKKPHTYWTHACTRTRVFDESEAKALRALRE